MTGTQNIQDKKITVSTAITAMEYQAGDDIPTLLNRHTGEVYSVIKE